MSKTIIANIDDQTQARIIRAIKCHRSHTNGCEAVKKPEDYILYLIKQDLEFIEENTFINSTTKKLAPADSLRQKFKKTALANTTKSEMETSKLNAIRNSLMDKAGWKFLKEVPAAI